jgi:hypothetical protein
MTEAHWSIVSSALRSDYRRRSIQYGLLSMSRAPVGRNRVQRDGRSAEAKARLSTQPGALCPSVSTEGTGAALGEREAPAGRPRVPLTPSLSPLQDLGTPYLGFTFSLDRRTGLVDDHPVDRATSKRCEKIGSHDGVTKRKIDPLGTNR